MSPVPSWAPNLHPALVHFPIVLLLGALVADAVWLLLPKRTSWRSGALVLYALGIATLVITYLTGRQAGDAVVVPDTVVPSLSKHATLGRWALVFWLIYFPVRAGAALVSWDRKRAVLAALVAVSAAGYYFVATAAEHGAQLVYRYGVGTQAPSPQAAAESRELRPGSFLATRDSVVWKIGGNALSVLRDSLSWSVDVPERARVSVSDSNGAPELTIRLDRAAAKLLLPARFDNLALEALLNLDKFDGELRLLHHVGVRGDYDFFGLRSGAVSLSRVKKGRTREFARKAVNATGWLRLKVVSSSGHYRGYVNGKLVLHAHSQDLEPGTAGLTLQGTGSVQIREIRAKRLTAGNE